MIPKLDNHWSISRQCIGSSLFFNFCPNLKALRCEYLDKHDFSWLHHEYSKLEHVMIFIRGTIIKNLATFLKKNQQLKHLEINSCVLLHNSETFINSKLKLDVLTIQYKNFFSERVTSYKVCTLLNQLHDTGFYRRSEWELDPGCCIKSVEMSHIGTLRGLEKFSGTFYANVLTTIVDLKVPKIRDWNI